MRGQENSRGGDGLCCSGAELAWFGTGTPKRQRGRGLKTDFVTNEKPHAPLPRALDRASTNHRAKAEMCSSHSAWPSLVSVAKFPLKPMTNSPCLGRQGYVTARGNQRAVTMAFSSKAAPPAATCAVCPWELEGRCVLGPGDYTGPGPPLPRCHCRALPTPRG